MTFETKYNVGDIVWAMYDNKPYEFEIYAVRAAAFRHCDGSKTQRIVYNIGKPRIYGSPIFDQFPEEDMPERFFASKDELRKSIFGE